MLSPSQLQLYSSDSAQSGGPSSATCEKEGSGQHGSTAPAHPTHWLRMPAVNCLQTAPVTRAHARLGHISAQQGTSKKDTAAGLLPPMNQRCNLSLQAGPQPCCQHLPPQVAQGKMTAVHPCTALRPSSAERRLPLVTGLTCTAAFCVTSTVLSPVYRQEGQGPEGWSQREDRKDGGRGLTHSAGI